ncbi:cytochrome P450 [Nonomuraea phyllanthi]|uniref:Cytochrome P450 n=1 Tax=Nonomuraea phyllanthi TaxID=2219224 RepID=A0A5C4WT13_9ACTN|nr:cytochrome P450 [Nonomuraea phyllanthi]KAB8196710.1 cytochrome P450 [Nonomuraea phyllanthi]QFY13551.1 cytochrome P450 [Nonomuraea phyllanthi]
MTETSAMPPHMRRMGFDPAPELAAIRDGGGVERVTTAFGMEAWLVTRYADVREVLGDAERFRIARQTVARLPGAPEMTPEQLAKAQAGNLLGVDPPEHTRLRRMLTPEFTIRRIQRLEPRIRRIVDDHLDAMEAAGAPADLVRSFALPIPSLVICELLGVPYEDRDGFQHRTSRMLDMSAPGEERLALQFESRAYMEQLVRRIQRDPGDELLGMLVREHGDDLSTDELVGIGALLLFAGHETTSNMLSLGTLALLRHPDQLELLRKEPERIDATVEELLRWLSIVNSGTTKVTTTEVELGGRTIGAGELVIVALPAANRDPELLPDADTFDLSRGAPGHVAFGHGVHHCLGAPLARMELRIALPALLQRFPGLREAGAAGFRASHIVYGLSALDVAW